MSGLLGDVAIAAALAQLDGWSRSETGKTIEKTYEFPSFARAMSFMVEAAIAADKADHHPEWTNVYNRVEVTLTSHDAGGVTERDIALAREMERIARA